jgi:hypothetical protein
MLDGREEGDASDLFMIKDDETDGDGETERRNWYWWSLRTARSVLT